MLPWSRLCIVVSVFLFIISFWSYAESILKSAQKSQEKQNYLKNNQRYKKTSKWVLQFFNSKEIRKLFFEVGVVILGASLAIVCTVGYEQNETEKRLYNGLKIAGTDMLSQNTILYGLVSDYEHGKIDANTLRYNSIVDITLIENIIFNNDIIMSISNDSHETKPYSALLSNYRSINDYISFLASDNDMADEYTEEICHRLTRHIGYLCDEIDEFLNWKLYKTISYQDYLTWFENHCNIMQNENQGVASFSAIN